MVILAHALISRSFQTEGARLPAICRSAVATLITRSVWNDAAPIHCRCATDRGQARSYRQRKSTTICMADAEHQVIRPQARCDSASS